MPVASDQRTISKATLQATLHIASSMLFAEVLPLLDALSITFANRRIYDDTPTAQPITLRQLGYAGNNLIKPCSEVGPVWFCGGPPGKRDWMAGMVSQYVADCILCAIVERGERVVGAEIDAVFRIGAP